MGHNQHSHIHLSEILDLRELYHHNNILFYGSKNSILPPINNLTLQYPSDIIFGPFYIKPGLIFYTATHVLLITVLVSESTFPFTFFIF